MPVVNESYTELFEIADQLKQLASKAEDDDIKIPLDATEKAVMDVDRSFSGSWLGYHANIYYKELQSPPLGEHFGQNWGLVGCNFGGLALTGDWHEYEPEVIKKHILEKSGKPDLDRIWQIKNSIDNEFEKYKSEISSILNTDLDDRSDTYLTKLMDELNELELISYDDVVEKLCSNEKITIHDITAAQQGFRTPPHYHILAIVYSIRATFNSCSQTAEIARKAASHLERQSRKKQKSERVGTNVFIGHGGSGAWRELKDFVRDRLKLPWDEFNRIPVAGVTNISRLSEMLDSAAIAFLVMTAEDEMADGNMQARMNVIHEAGLFQGRLGFNRAIVLLEEGCHEFSNIAGLGQIRFPANRIAASFEEVRRVLEREQIIAEA